MSVTRRQFLNAAGLSAGAWALGGVRLGGQSARVDAAVLRQRLEGLSVFGRPVTTPLSDKAKADADELVRIAGALIAPGKTTMFGEYCIADTDLALALMRLVANHDPVPQPLVDYARAQWERTGVRKYLSHVPK